MIPQEAISLIKESEGLRLKSYWDAHGEVWTVGYGDTGPLVDQDTVITEMEATQRLITRINEEFVPGVLKALTREPTANQLGAYVSLAYNIGVGAFARSTTVKRFNRGDIIGAADAILWFNKSGGVVLNGLVTRRSNERTLFLKPDKLKVLSDDLPHVEIVENAINAPWYVRAWRWIERKLNNYAKENPHEPS